VAVLFEISQGFLNDLSVGCPKLFTTQIILELNNDTRLAIERAGTETPHLQRGAPDFYPNNTNFDLNRRASPRPYLWADGAI
jgi:hypothetical protein